MPPNEASRPGGGDDDHRGDSGTPDAQGTSPFVTDNGSSPNAQAQNDNAPQAHWIDLAAVEFGIAPAPEPRKPRPPADFTITDPDWVKAKCMEAIETLAVAQDNQAEGTGRAYNLWPRALMAYLTRFRE